VIKYLLNEFELIRIEEDIKGHKLEVKIKWSESKEKTTVFKLEEKKFLNLGF